MSWNAKQKGILGAYRRYSGIGDQDYRDLLYRATGQRSSTAAGLRQADFDAVMPLIETWAHLAEINKTAVGTRPWCIGDWRYWRKRRGGPLAISTRQRKAISEWWEMCGKWMAAEEHTREYLLGVAGGAVGREIQSLDDLGEREASLVLEALKSLARRLARQATREASAAVVARINAGGVQDGGDGAA